MNPETTVTVLVPCPECGDLALDEGLCWSCFLDAETFAPVAVEE